MVDSSPAEVEIRPPLHQPNTLFHQYPDGLLGGSEALKRHNDNTEANYLKPGLIDRKTKELLIIVACVASGDLVSHIQIHMHAAYKAGATPEEIMEALNLVGSWIGIRKAVGLEAWRATFRPDIPTIDRVVELR